MAKEHPDWLENAAKTIKDDCVKECDEKRTFMVPIWRRAEYYWNDVQDIFWDAQSNELKVVAEGRNELEAIFEANKIVNTYRAYGESLIAAATVGNLSIRFFPGNADDSLDIEKSRAYTEISDYIQRLNDLRHLRRQAFRIRWNQGIVASYTWFKRDKDKYGTIEKDVIGTKRRILADKVCANPECGETVASKEFDNPEDLAADVELQQSVKCPNCGGEEFDSVDRQEDTPYSLGKETIEKGCSVIELFGPTELRFPYYVKEVEQINYVELTRDLHYATARRLFPEHAAKINPGNRDRDEEDRAQADAYGINPTRNTVAVHYFWCKPELYYIIWKDGEDNKQFKNLEKKYPNGLFATFVGEVLVDCQDVDFTKHWTFLRSPLDSHVNVRALGAAMIPLQDMENDLVYLTMDTIKHAIGETFYDQNILSRTNYEKARARPGNMVPVELRGGKPIGEHFHSTKTATLSREVDAFYERLETRGQLVTGAFPSVYGGQFSEGSKTLGVYQESKAQALQRTAIPANGIDDLLTETIYKATELYDQNMQGDESYAVEDGSGYKNITLRKSSGGKIHRVETVRSEQFPTTWEQKRAFIMELLGLGLDPINATLFSTDNISTMARIFGIPELKVPGDAMRNKVLMQIQQMLKEEPVQSLDPNGQPAVDPKTGEPIPVMPSVMPDMDVDNHDVAIDTIISWAISPEGIRANKQNPQGYRNVIAQLQIRKKMVMMKEIAQQPPPSAAPPMEGV